MPWFLPRTSQFSSILKGHKCTGIAVFIEFYSAGPRICILIETSSSFEEIAGELRCPDKKESPAKMPVFIAYFRSLVFFVVNSFEKLLPCP
jgi:hypothetical protein